MSVRLLAAMLVAASIFGSLLLAVPASASSHESKPSNVSCVRELPALADKKRIGTGVANVACYIEFAGGIFVPEGNFRFDIEVTIPRGFTSPTAGSTHYPEHSTFTNIQGMPTKTGAFTQSDGWRVTSSTGSITFVYLLAVDLDDTSPLSLTVRSVLREREDTRSFGHFWWPTVYSNWDVAVVPGLEPTQPQTVEILVKSFIPQNHAILPLGTETWVFGGDDRGFSYESGRFRTFHRIHVKVESRQTPEFSSPVLATGTTHRYDISALDNGQIDADDVPVQSGKAPVDGLVTEHRVIEGDIAIVDLRGRAADPLVRSAPSLDYCYSIMLRPQLDGSVEYTLTGGNDDFPAYEVYMNGTPVVQYMPPDDNPLRLFGGCHDVPVSAQGLLPPSTPPPGDVPVH